MPFLSDRLIDGVIVFSLAILLLSLFLVVYAIGRRVRHEQDFEDLDAFRSRLGDVFKALVEHTMDYSVALAKVGGMFRPRLGSAMEQALLERMDIPGDEDFVRQMAEDLGFVLSWQQDLGGSGVSGVSGKVNRRAGQHRVSRRQPGYLTRARSAENLGRIRHGKSWQLLARSLDDPHPDVQGVALRSLAAMGEPQSFPILVERLRIRATQASPSLSERSLRAAMGHFPVQLGGALLPLLHDSNAKLRRLAADVLVEMLQSSAPPRGATCCTQIGIPEHANLESAGPQISQVILTWLVCDEDADVRARTASLLGYAQSAIAGRKLGQLLEDEAWFVRLHAVRAIAARKDACGVDLLAPRLTDASWRVRESAAHALSQFGAEGLDRLVQSFLSTDDAYAREQIAEELATSGNLAGLIALRAEGAHDREIEVLDAMISMGRANRSQNAPEARLEEPQHA